MYLAGQDIERFWQRELVYDAARCRNAAKIALASIICVSFGLVFHLSRYDWMLFTISVLMMPTVGTSVEKASRRVMGTITGALYGTALMGAFPQDNLMLLVGFFVLVLVAVYFTNRPVSPYAFFIFGLTAMIIILDSLQNPVQAPVLAASRTFEIVTGVIVVTLVAANLWPVYAHRDIEANLSRISGFCGGLVAQIRGALFENRPIDDSWRRRTLEFSDLIVKTYGLLRYAGFENARYKLAQNALTTLTMQFENLLANLDSARRVSKDGLPDGLHRLAAAELQTALDAIIKRLDDVGRNLTGGLSASAMEPVTESWDAAVKRLDELRQQRRQYDFPVDVLAKEHTVFSMLARTVEALGEIEAAILHFHSINAQVGPPSDARVRMAEAWNQLTTFDPAVFRIAVTAAFMTTGLLALLPPDVLGSLGPAIVLGAYVVIKTTNLAVSERTAWIVISSSVVGCVVGIGTVIWVLPTFEGIFGFMIWTAIVMFGFAYVAYGSPDYSLAGSQGMLIYIFAVGSAFAPPLTALDAVVNAVGWTLGVAIIMLPLAAFWPARVAPKRRAILIAHYRRLVRLLRGFCFPHPHRYPPEEVRVRRHDVLEQLSVAQQLCVQGRIEGEETPQRYADISSLVRLSSGLFFKMEALENTLYRYQSQPDTAELEQAFNRCVEVMAAGCDELAAALEARRPPILPDMATAVKALTDQLTQLTARRQQGGGVYTLETIGPLLALVEGVRQVEEAIRFCGDARLRLALESQPVQPDEAGLVPSAVRS